MRSWIAVTALVGCVFFGSSARAAKIDWTLTGATFNGGNVAVNGTFATNDSQTISYDLLLTGAISSEWTQSNTTLASVGTTSFDITVGSNELMIVFTSDLDGLTSPDSVSGGFVCVGNCNYGEGFNYTDSTGGATGVPEATPAPEPASMALLGSGMIALAGLRKLRRKG